MKLNSWKKRGYTFVEVVVAVAIAVTIISIAFAGYAEVKKTVRDKQRVSDLEQVRIALRLYREANGSYPDIPGGVVIGEGGSLDALLGGYMGQIPHDPLGPGNASYQYYYDSDYDCRSNGNSSDETVIYALKTEKSSMANWGRNPTVTGVCEPTGAAEQAEYYGVILGSEVP